MNVIPIEVPEDIEYISQWTSFIYPLGHLILDKTICGCGFTEYCLNNNIPTVLCSPRKKLLENKEEQHNSDKGKENGLREVYYFRNEEETVNYDTPFDEGDEVKKAETNQIIKENLENLKQESKEAYLVKLKRKLSDYIDFCNSTKSPFKIIVTYDSLHHVLDVLSKKTTLDSFAVVVDEFQSIFMDSSFKSEVELDFIDDLKSCANVLYLSATPMLEKYLVQLDYFKDLPFYKLIWPESRIEHVRVERKITRNIGSVLSTWIDNYRKGIFPNKILPNGELRESKELVIFVNSVKSICDIIRKNKLTSEETNIICSESLVNLNKLKKVGHIPGNIPTFGQPHKQFTLCTRTSYLGADFYSTSAFTIICSDCNIKTLTVDISLDLPQIIGRQRLKENVFRNEVLFLYKAAKKDEAIINLTEEQSKAEIYSKETKTRELLKEYDKMSEKGKELWADIAKDRKSLYKNDYLGVSKRTGKVVFNYLIEVADQRAFDVSRKEYQDDVTIKRGIESLTNVVVDTSDNVRISDDLQNLFYQFKEEYENLPNSFEVRMQLIHETYLKYPQLFEQFGNILDTIIPRTYQNYINLLGFERIKALKYYEYLIKNEIDNINKLNTESVSTSILSLFSVGSKYSKAQIKEMLREFYSVNSISKTPKASDLEDYFNLKTCKVKNSEGKWENGFEIVSLK